MACVSCGSRKGRRDCPALGGSICTVCCGTKRLVDIACPDTCPHLATAREHPAAAVKRQQERDLAIVLPTIRSLTERQYQLFFLFHTLIARHVPDGFSRLLDEDVADAAAAVAATLETAARGVIYDHQAQMRTGQRLAAEITTMLAEMRQQGATVYDREAAMTLRAIERGAKETRDALARAGAGPEGPQAATAYLDIIARLLQVNRAAKAAAEPEKRPSPLILP